MQWVSHASVSPPGNWHRYQKRTSFLLLHSSTSTVTFLSEKRFEHAKRSDSERDDDDYHDCDLFCCSSSFIIWAKHSLPPKRRCERVPNGIWLFNVEDGVINRPRAFPFRPSVDATDEVELICLRRIDRAWPATRPLRRAVRRALETSGSVNWFSVESVLDDSLANDGSLERGCRFGLVDPPPCCGRRGRWPSGLRALPWSKSTCRCRELLDGLETWIAGRTE